MSRFLSRVQASRPAVSHLKSLRDDRSGVVAVIFALMTPMLLAGVGFAVDGALMYTARNRLQVAADAAALGAAQDLGNAVTKAQGLAATNIDGTGASSNVLTSGDVVTGKWDATARTFSAGGSSPNAVRVTTRFSSANGNAHQMLFAGFLGIDAVNIAATATALAEGGMTCTGNVLLYKDPAYVPPATARSVNTLGGPCGSPCPAGFKGPNGHLQTPEGHPVLRLDVGSATFAAKPSQTLTVKAGSAVDETYTLPGPGRWFVVVISFTNPYDINDVTTKTKPKTNIVYSNFGSGTATWANDVRGVMSFTQPAQCPANATAVGGSEGSRLVG